MSNPQANSANLNHDNWAGTTYGNGWMHRWLVRMLRVIDLRVIYAFAFIFAVPPTLLINGRARRAIYGFMRRGQGFGRLKSAWLTLLNHCAFATVVIDKFAMYAGKKFDIDIDGYDQFEQLATGPEGFVQLSSHIGCYEIAGYSLRTDLKPMNALVFAGEKATVMEERAKLFGGNNIRMVPMMPDMSHLFTIDQALSRGEIISMPADRVFGSQKTFECPLLQGRADLPQGPFILAALRQVPMLFVAVMKTGATRYRITVTRIDQPDMTSSRQRAAALARRYAELLSDIVRRHPCQWYNYFDYLKPE